MPFLIQGVCDGPQVGIACNKKDAPSGARTTATRHGGSQFAAGYAESLALRADSLVTEIPLKGGV